MRILIVDDDASKYAGIVEECKNRKIEYEIIDFKEMKIEKFYRVDALVLGMGKPIYLDGEPLWSDGEKILRCMESRGYRIETLIFSEISPLSNYVFVHSRIEDWNTQKDKFLKFLKDIKEPVY